MGPTRYSVAFKCTYNDGGQGALVGFAGTCSRDIIDLNIRKYKHVWCSSPLCPCRNFYDGGMKEDKPAEPCDESKLFTKWEFGAGGFHTGVKSGQPIHLVNAEIGKFAILTTRFPGDKEADRRIMGLFQIGDIKDQNTFVAAPEGRIRLPLEEAKELYFWAYCSNNANTPVWKTGLFRYLEDGQVHRILVDVGATVRDEETRSQISPRQSCLWQLLLRSHRAACLRGVPTASKRSRRRGSTAWVAKVKTTGHSRNGLPSILKPSAWSIRLR